MEPEHSEVELDQIRQERIKGANKSNVDHDHSEEASQTSKKPAATTRRWNSFVESTTLHGMLYVFTGQTLVRRILWAVFLLSAISWFSFQSSKLLRKYFSYPVTTKVYLEYEGSPEFPAVTICNFNMVKRSVVMAKGYDELFSQLEEILLGSGTENVSIDFSKYSDFNSTEFILMAGHQIEETLLGCIWGGKMCDYRSFTPALTDMGLCFTFNSGTFLRRKILT